MGDIKNKVQGVDPNVTARDVLSLAKKTGNIYEALAVITQRSKQLAVDIKQELHNKLEEFAVHSDTIEEVTENKEQVEISKFYERLPNPVIIALEEYTNDELHYHFDKKKKRLNG